MSDSLVNHYLNHSKVFYENISEALTNKNYYLSGDAIKTAIPQPLHFNNTKEFSMVIQYIK